MGEKEWSPSFTELLDRIWGPKDRLNAESAEPSASAAPVGPEAAPSPVGDPTPEPLGADETSETQDAAVDALMREIGEAVNPRRGVEAAPEPPPAVLVPTAIDDSALEADLEALMREIGVAVETALTPATTLTFAPAPEPATAGPDVDALMRAIGDAVGGAPYPPRVSKTNPGATEG